jgi:hypothetical protein
MYVGAFGRVHEPDAPAGVDCQACGDHARRLSSVSHGSDRYYHHYDCERADCPAGGTIIETDGSTRGVGPVFGDRDLAVQLAAREQQQSLTAGTREVRP